MLTWFEDDTLGESLESFLFSQWRSSEITVRDVSRRPASAWSRARPDHLGDRA